MLKRISPTVMIHLKSVLYLLVFVIWFLPFYGIAHARVSGGWDLWAWYALVIIFGLVPLLDHVFGQDPANPTDQQVEAMTRNHYYAVLALAMLPWQYWNLYQAGEVMATAPFGVAGYLGWMVSVGFVGAIIAINTGHELTHKDSRIEQWAGGLLLASVCYAGFKVEHIRGHHVTVSTPEDASSARYGQSLYRFLPHAFKHNFLNAWKLEAERLRKKNLPAFHWRNELIWWYSISAGLAIASFALWGWIGALFFVGQGFFAALLLEIINYVEHYGLHRRKLPNGRYERPTPAHSWNSNFFFTNMMLFHLQRHSDHHAHPKRRYQVLRHFDGSPQLPSGYASMVVLALLPPLWFRVMNPRVEAYYKGEEWQLGNEQFDANAKVHADA